MIANFIEMFTITRLKNFEYRILLLNFNKI